MRGPPSILNIRVVHIHVEFPGHHIQGAAHRENGPTCLLFYSTSSGAPAPRWSCRVFISAKHTSLRQTRGMNIHRLGRWSRRGENSCKSGHIKSVSSWSTAIPLVGWFAVVLCCGRIDLATQSDTAHIGHHADEPSVPYPARRICCGDIARNLLLRKFKIK